MKVFFIIAFLATLIAIASGRGCRYIMGRCVEECGENTHAYVSACRSPTWSQKTCDEPEAYDMGPICDLSRCDCDEPLLLDRSTGKCVNKEDCPAKE